MKMAPSWKLITAIFFTSILSGGHVVSAARILCLFPFPSASHNIVFRSLTTELAKRGHELVVLTSHPMKTPVPNIKEIDIHFAYNELKKNDVMEMTNITILSVPFLMFELGDRLCEMEFESPQVQEIINMKKQFDLLIVELFFLDSFLGFAHKFPAPIIGISSFGAMSWINTAVGNPNILSVDPNPFLPFNDRMSFGERLINTLFTFYFDSTRKYFSRPSQNKIARRYLGEDTPPLEDIERNISLVFVNNHFALNYPRPNVPNLVEIGGIHVKEPQKLPKDLQTYLDDAKQGFIYFSLGTNLRSDLLPAEKKQALLDAFAAIPQRVLWKFESDSLPGQPKNVRLGKWLPQQDILAHPNIKLFITHGGLLSTQEASYRGVPLIGIPFFGDQLLNMARVQAAGYGLTLDYKNLTKANILTTIKTIVNDASFKENANRLSRLLKDQPETPLSRAVYWTEYVIRHKGAPHLKSSAVDLTWYQYSLLDVLAVIALAGLIAVSVVCLVVRKLFSLVLGRKKTKKE